MSVNIDATPDLLLFIQQKWRTVQYGYGSLSACCYFKYICVCERRHNDVNVRFPLINIDFAFTIVLTKLEELPIDLRKSEDSL